MRELQLCHAENPKLKFMGICNMAKVHLDDCFRVEKEQRRDDKSRKLSEPEGFDAGWQAHIDSNPKLQKLVKKIENKK